MRNGNFFLNVNNFWEFAFNNNLHVFFFFTLFYARIQAKDKIFYNFSFKV